MKPGVWKLHGDAPSDPRPTLYLDRDGVIVEDAHYLADPEQVRLIPGAAGALARAASAGYRLVCLTNQSGIGRGYYGVDDFERVQARIDTDLEAADVVLDAVLYCPHAPDAACSCRKPAVGMVDAANAVLPHAAGSWMIGDKLSDVELGLAAGLQSILVLTGQGADAAAQLPVGVHRADDLADAVDLILEATS